MKAQYEARGWIKHAEEDIYACGCQPDTGSIFDGSDRFQAATIPELIESLMSFTGCNDRESVLLNSCDEPGRVDIQTMETEEGYPATESDIATWKQGHKRLWLATYTFHVEKVTRETVSIAE